MSSPTLNTELSTSYLGESEADLAQSNKELVSYTEYLKREMVWNIKEGWVSGIYEDKDLIIL